MFPAFDTYVDQERGGWGGSGTCSGCLRPAERLTRDEASECEYCVRTMFGDDQARHQIALAVAQVRNEILAPLERWGD